MSTTGDAHIVTVTCPPATCTHSRLIDDVRKRSGERTGKVRCLECKAVFEDPYRGMK